MLELSDESNNTSKGKNNDDDQYLRVNNEGWKRMFDHVINPTIQHITKLLNEPKLMRNCKYLCLAGGLSISPYFQSRLREEFGPKSRYRLTLVIPQRPILSVVEGAAYFAITPNYIKARVLKYTYGESLNWVEKYAIEQSIPNEYIEKHKFYNKFKKTWCVKDCFTIMAKKGQEIYTGQIIKSTGRRSSPEQMSISTCVMVSKLEDPKVKGDGRPLGEIETKFPNNDMDDMRVTLEFHFYETVIKAVVYRKKEPDEKQTHYITNYK